MFDESKATNIIPVQRGGDLYIEWTSTEPPGTWFQVYSGGVMLGATRGGSIVVPVPTGHGLVRVGAVDPAERASNLSATLAPAASPSNRATIRWTGGDFLGADLAGFKVYGSAVAGGPVDFARPLADIPATPDQSGYGFGPYGRGRYGRSAVAYRWTSGELGSGLWTFAVASYDRAGNQSSDGPTISVESVVMPRPPARFPAGDRLRASLDPATLAPTLNWLPSPDA